MPKFFNPSTGKVSSCPIVTRAVKTVPRDQTVFSPLRLKTLKSDRPIRSMTIGGRLLDLLNLCENAPSILNLIGRRSETNDHLNTLLDEAEHQLELARTLVGEIDDESGGTRPVQIGDYIEWLDDEAHAIEEADFDHWHADRRERSNREFMPMSERFYELKALDTLSRVARDDAGLKVTDWQYRPEFEKVSAAEAIDDLNESWDAHTPPPHDSHGWKILCALQS